MNKQPEALQRLREANEKLILLAKEAVAFDDDGFDHDLWHTRWNEAVKASKVVSQRQRTEPIGGGFYQPLNDDLYMSAKQVAKQPKN